MILAWRAGSRPACRSAVPVQLDRGLAFAGVGALAAFNAIAPQLVTMLRETGLFSTFSWLGGVSAVIWFALYALLCLGLSDEAEPLRRADGLVLLAGLIVALLPVTFVPELSTLALGLYLFIGSAPDTRERRIAMVLLALTGPLVWGKLLLNVFAQPVLSLDARLVGLVLHSPVDGNVLYFAHSSRRFLIAAPCSSIHNISLAILLWTVALALFRLRFDTRLVFFGIAATLLMYGLNFARLAMIGLHPEQFIFLHNGLGAVLFGWAGLIGAGLIVGLGTSDALRRQR